MTKKMLSNWFLVMLLFGGFCLVGCRGHKPTASAQDTNLPAGLVSFIGTGAVVNSEGVGLWEKLAFPTDQQKLLDQGATGVFQPTAAGSVESALFGSVRTAQKGKRLQSSFHEGVDIAALQRDRHGRPLDKVYAIAPGKITYFSKTAGNSNYGRYVVIAHTDQMGDVYSIYAHLTQVDPRLVVGQSVEPGTILGVMGNSSSSAIPIARAHLHLELGLMLNSRFAAWFRSQKLKPDHGNYHGWNVLAVDPIAFFRQQRTNPQLSFEDYLATIKPAFDVLLASKRLPDFFQRYEGLWSGAEFNGKAIVVSCSENGVPLQGRNASDEESQSLNGKRQAKVLRVDEKVLGRNGYHLIARRGSSWELAENGKRWLTLLLY